jgi:small ligand-binding sensory domain FIST
VDSNTGNTVAVGKAVQFVVSAGTAAQSPYEITVTAATNSTPAETLKKLLILSCE